MSINDVEENYKLVKSCKYERYFFNTFGYYQLDVGKKDIRRQYEEDIVKDTGIDKVPCVETVRIGDGNRTNNIRFSRISDHDIFSVFYNKKVYDTLSNIAGDFIILSDIESFYLKSTEAHRDIIAELKQIKLLFYLDDVSEIDKGPLWVIPGTHHMYDKYSSCVGLNVQWPTPDFGAGGGFITEQNNKIPKTHLLSNKDRVIMFNHNLIHGSEGNTKDTQILRRAIAMTVLCVDRNSTKIMDKIYRLFSSFNISHHNCLIYQYCEKNSPDWIRHFYFYKEDIRYNSNIKSTFIKSEDGTDKNAIIKDLNTNRWKFYLDHIRATRNELINNNLFNTYIDSVKLLKNNADNDDDVKGL